MRRLAIAVSLVALAACRGASRPDAGAAPRSRATPATSTTPVVVAPTADPTPPDPVVDLLHTVDCTVAVSSKVDNPLDFPEHLVDGKPETAWNGRTGDLRGFIAFRVPKSARVTRVELTAGFDKVGPKGDLFTMNHRITKVRLSAADGRVITEAALDPSARGMQALVVDEPGGDFELDILETVPGSEKRWRELTVSEFRVWGRAGGAPPNPTHLPRMAIGSLDGVRSPPKPSWKQPAAGPFASLAELCRAYDRAITPAIDAAFPGNRYPGKVERPHCNAVHDEKDVSAELTKGPFLGGSWAHFNDSEKSGVALVLQTAAGYSRTKVALYSRYLDDPGCMHGSHHVFEDARLMTTSTGQPVLVIRVVHKDVYWMLLDPSLPPIVIAEEAFACHVDEKGGVVCEGPLVTGSAHPPATAAFDPAKASTYEIDIATIPWTFRREPTLGPAGDLRVAP